MGSDHNPVMADVRIRFKKLRMVNNSRGFDTEKLQNKTVSKDLEKTLHQFIKLEDIDHSDIEEARVSVKSKIVDAGEKILGKRIIKGLKSGS